MAPTTHDLTVAEIKRLARDYREQRQAAVTELIQFEKRRAAGTPEPAPLSDTENLARSRAVELINGYGSAANFLPPPASREQALRVEIDALDMVLDALQQRQVQQRSVEAVQWQREHGAEWNALVRDIVMTASRLQALEAKAAAMRAERGMFGLPLPLEAFIGAKSVLGMSWAHDPLGQARRAALAEKIVSERELKEAARVE